MHANLDYTSLEIAVNNLISAAGGIQMTVCLVIIAIVLAQAGVGQEGHVSEPWVAWFVLVFVCIYIAAYAWSCKLCSFHPCCFCIGVTHDFFTLQLHVWASSRLNQLLCKCPALELDAGPASLITGKCHLQYSYASVCQHPSFHCELHLAAAWLFRTEDLMYLHCDSHASAWLPKMHNHGYGQGWALISSCCCWQGVLWVGCTHQKFSLWRLVQPGRGLPHWSTCFSASSLDRHISACCAP